ncbi:tRNA pseudouridine(55) synthase TruB [Arcobacter sp. FWKO B]|uniref:tRNA pseudouridine(55) synthase TruB n=1 Tax=Arcobacter sp. FWKO B TaxID=2593672 RepID=UPI0018A573C8|nr:tRNA pseudouridine(55) synthase TruB [Arcobacter sp. FWKO B]QOG11993.1 tRNA pseudouridine(55) synthase TruB [Arcobacter sp. FWKO B]
MSQSLHNRLFVAHKPIFVSSNSFLHRLKRKYGVKKGGFSGTLDPFACGTLIVAFGQYSRLFQFLQKTPKTYRATIWLGTTSDSYDLENIQSIENTLALDVDKIKNTIKNFIGSIEYIPPKYSAKRINGIRAYELARSGEEFELNKSVMEVSDIKFISYSHPFITFEASVSEGSYIRSLAQLICEKLGTNGTLSYLQRLNEGKFVFEDEKALNPIEALDLPIIGYSGTKEWIYDGKKLGIEYFDTKEDGMYLMVFDDFFSIIQIQNEKVDYILNKVLL